MLWLIVGCIIGFGLITWIYGDLFLYKKFVYGRRKKPKQETELHKYIFKDPINLKYNIANRVSGAIPFPLSHTPTRELVGSGCNKCVERLNFCRKKILDFQDLLAEHEQGIRELNPDDVIRYRGMVEILTQVIE